jgi:choline kinase
MRGVILAAGQGTRLSNHSRRRHKVLLPVGERTVIEYTLDAFWEVGVTDLAVIIGYRGEALKEWLGDGSRYGVRISYVVNPDYVWGNALSVNVARLFTRGEPFLLSMGDHMVSPGVLQQLLGAPEKANALAVDFAPSERHVEEGTRVQVSPDGLITHIGKSLDTWSGIDAGAFRLTYDIFDAMDCLLQEARAEYELSQGITWMIGQGHPLHACDISGFFWHDVDTWEDLVYVRERVVGGGS